MQNAATPPDALRRRAMAALVLVNVLWGFSFPSMKMTNQLAALHLQAADDTIAPRAAIERHDGAIAAFYLALRFAMALLLLVLFLPSLFRGMTAAHWLMGATVGTTCAAGSLLQIAALNDLPASRSGFLTSLCVVFTPLLMIVFLRRLPRRAVVGGITLALTGTAILTGVAESFGSRGAALSADTVESLGRGDVLTTLAAAIYAVQILLIDAFSRRMPGAKITPGMFLALVLAGIAAFGWQHARSPAPPSLAAWATVLVDARFLLLTLVTSLFCSVVAFYWMNKYQAYVSPAHAALIYAIEPIFATLWALILPGAISPHLGIDYPSEQPGGRLIVGGLLVVAGNVLAAWPSAARTTPGTPREYSAHLESPR